MSGAEGVLESNLKRNWRSLIGLGPKMLACTAPFFKLKPDAAPALVHLTHDAMTDAVQPQHIALLMSGSGH